MAVNENRSDLLLDSEVRQFAEPARRGPDDRPRYRMTPETLRAARRQGVDTRSLDDWFRRRTESRCRRRRGFCLPAMRRRRWRSGK